MTTQTFATKPVQSTSKMREAYYRVQDEQYDRMAYKARRAIRKARALTREAEEFIARMDEA